MFFRSAEVLQYGSVWHPLIGERFITKSQDFKYGQSLGNCFLYVILTFELEFWWNESLALDYLLADKQPYRSYDYKTCNPKNLTFVGF